MNLRFVYEREYDVVVCGIGSAGFCAAVACARHGLKTAAVDSFHMPGGVLTMLGNSCIHQFNNPYRAPGDRMIIRGIGWEYVNRLAAAGDARVADQDAPYTGNHSQYGVWVNPVGASYTMAEMLTEAGAALYFGHHIVDTVCTDTPVGRRVDGVVVSTKDGPALLRAKYVIDCTGDADICAYSGFSCLTGDDGIVQPGSIYVNGTEYEVPYHASESDRLSHDEIVARKTVLDSNRPAWILSTPAIAPRESRRVVCRYMMTYEDYMECRTYPDAVCYTFWFIDIHTDSHQTHIEYLKGPETPSIRLASLIPVGSVNVLVAGRCIGTDRAANSAIRVKATCMALGEAAGAAAKTAIDTGTMDAAAVRKLLADTGAVVPTVE